MACEDCIHKGVCQLKVEYLAKAKALPEPDRHFTPILTCVHYIWEWKVKERAGGK